MSKYIIILIFFLISCSSNKIISDENNTNKIDFSKNENLNQFIIKLKDYANNNPYPKID